MCEWKYTTVNTDMRVMIMTCANDGFIIEQVYKTSESVLYIEYCIVVFAMSDVKAAITARPLLFDGGNRIN